MEGVVVEGDGARSSEGRALTLAGRGAAGLRIEWAGTLGLGTSISGWLPAWHEDLSEAGNVITLNDPGWALGLHLTAQIAW